MVKTVSDVLPTANDERTGARRAVYRVLETASEGDRLSRSIDVLLVGLIIASVVAVILESIPALAERHEAAFYWFEVATVSVFSIEYLLRVWSSVEAPAPESGPKSPAARRLRFMLSFHALIDLVAILPFFLITFGVFGNADMRFLRAIRLLRVLKLTRYSAAFDMLITTIAENGRNLSAAFVILLTVMLLAASGIYYFEREAQPVAFGSIPAAMWWAFSTLTTVGYGDVTPITAGGKMFGACITVVGLGMVALPTGILASGFAQQLRSNSDQFRKEAMSAWHDGVLTPDEVRELEKRRLELGLGRHTASQILDAGKVGHMLRTEKVRTEPDVHCPHCGGALSGD